MIRKLCEVCLPIVQSFNGPDADSCDATDRKIAASRNADACKQHRETASLGCSSGTESYHDEDARVDCVAGR
ncbi:MAG: hypothetical protein R3B13_17860 [Polyangiaceae bacterium]